MMDINDNLDPLQRLLVGRRMLTPKPRNWRLVAGLAAGFLILLAALLMYRG